MPLNSEAASLYQNDHLQYEQTARLWTQRYAKFENFEYSTLNNDSTESSTSSLLLLTDRSCEGPIMSLSDDILVAHILTRSYRKAIHLITHLGLVCKKWYRLVKSHILWRCIDPGIEFEYVVKSLQKRRTFVLKKKYHLGDIWIMRAFGNSWKSFLHKN